MNPTPATEAPPRAPSRATRWLWPAFASALAIAPIIFFGGGVVEEEAIGFLRNFWGERAVLQRIFDPRGYDFYQGRELSYAIDFLDAQWVRLLVSRGILVFAAPSALAAALAIVAIGVWLVPRALPRLPASVSWLLLALYLANFALASTTGILYRATKPLVAPLLLTLLLLLLAEWRLPRLGGRLAFALTFGLGLAMSLLDRQGLFYLLALLPLLLAAWLRSRRGLAFVLAAAAAAGSWAAYNYVLGPRIIHSLNGYWPEMRFQRLQPAWLLQPTLWTEAVTLLLDWTRVLLGGVPRAVAAGLALAAAVGFLLREPRRPLRLLARGGLLLAGLALQLAMLAIMVGRHQPVTWIDHRFWYFPLPFQALLLFGLLWGFERAAAARGGTLPRVVPLLLAALVAANVAQWPGRRALMETGPWFGDVARRSRLLLESLRQGREQPLLDGDHRRFYFECLDRFPRLSARAGPRVAEGGGVEQAEVEENRLVAWVGREAQLIVTTPDSGRHRLVGDLWLRPGERVSFLLGTSPPRLLAEVARDEAQEGSEPFRIPLELAPGRTGILLLAQLPELPGPRRNRPARSYRLFLPVSLERQEPAGTR